MIAATRTFIMCTPGSTLSDTTRGVIAQTYEDLAATNRLLGLHDIADRCERNASAARFGGVLQLEPPDGMP